jgi:hypothetical protein
LAIERSLRRENVTPIDTIDPLNDVDGEVGLEEALFRGVNRRPPSSRHPLQSAERPLREANDDFVRRNGPLHRPNSEFVEVEREAVDENRTAVDIDGESIEESSRLRRHDGDLVRASRRSGKHDRRLGRQGRRLALVTTTLPSRKRFLLDEG